jgi:hypothetical protein
MAALAGLGSALSAISSIATVAGTLISAQGTIAAGKAQQQAANYEAAQLDIKAKEEQAAAQREAEQLRRRKELALSSLQTRAAASGFSATDPTASRLAGEVAEYGTLQEQAAMYGGTSRRAGLEGQAAATRASGAAARQGASYRAAATIIGGISTLADRYNPVRMTSTAAPTGSRYDPIGPWQTSVNYGYG